MPTEINSGQPPIPNSRKGVGQANSSNTKELSSSESSPAEISAPPSETVSISRTGQQLQSLENSVRQEPEIREALVNAIKQSVDNGTYEIDNRKLAQSIEQFEVLLSRS